LRRYFYLFNAILVTIGISCILLFFMIDSESKSRKISLNGSFEVVASLTDVIEARKKWEIPLSQIVGKRNVFGFPEEKTATEKSRDNLLKPLQELVLPEVKEFEDKTNISFVDPLPISLIGIVYSSDEDSSVAIIADESDKTNRYYVGDKVKDATIIRIMKNRIVILRFNGQVETFFLHEQSNLLSTKTPADCVFKNQDGIFEIDLTQIKELVETVGGFLDIFDSVPYLDKDQKMLGLVILSEEPKALPGALELEKLDVLTSLSDFENYSIPGLEQSINFESYKNRKLIYKLIKSSKDGCGFKLNFERNGSKKSIRILFKENAKETSNVENKGKKINYEFVNKPKVSDTEKKERQNAIFKPKKMSAESKEESKKKFEENLARIKREIEATRKKYSESSESNQESY